jgi:flavin reductase (DIM6/NTAB) family NADH-FMN oxidoreductase RutF
MVTDLFGRLNDSPTPSDSDTADLQADARGARWLRRRLAGGVVAITTSVDGVYRASTVTACVSVSLEPPQFLVSIELDSQMDGWLLEAALFTLNILPWGQQFFADQFAGFTPLASPTFRGIDHFFSVTGAPVLTESIAWADCRIVSHLQTGDHRCFVGEAVAIGQGRGDERDPLLYYLSRYRRLGGIADRP